MVEADLSKVNGPHGTRVAVKTQKISGVFGRYPELRI